MSKNETKNKKLDDVFRFLQDNRRYNSIIQFGFYHESLTPYQTVAEKLKSLLWRVQNTQQRSQLNSVAAFWKGYENTIDQVVDFSTLLTSLGCQTTMATYNNLFYALKDQPSWGLKTAALFIKALYHIHTDARYNSFAFLPGVPLTISAGDKLYLPVDQVILNVFEKSFGMERADFVKINDFLSALYIENEIEIWDDLWFWGFITQKGSGGKRNFEWNEAKYYSIQHTPKDEDSVVAVKELANQFLKKLS